jgi:hypothetical protein
MKHLKGRKRDSLDALTRLLQDKYPRRGLTQDIVKKCLQDLIEKEFVAKSSDDDYEYLP